MGLFETKINRLESWARDDKEGPLSIELVPTDKCNLNCQSCWRQGCTEEELEEKFSQEMSDQRLRELIDEARDLDVKEIIFVGGGEPLTREIVPELMEKIKSYGIEGDLVTNGTLLDEEISEMLVRREWDRIKFSVDGPDPVMHDELRGKEGVFEKTMKNIKRISRLRNEKGQEKPKLYFNTVVSKKNFRKLPQIIKLGSDVGIDGIQLLPTTAFSESSKKMQLNEKELDDFMEILEKSSDIANELGLEDCNFSEFKEPKYIDRTESMHKVQMEEVKEQFSKEELNDIIEKEYSKKDNIEDFKYLPCYAPWHHITIRPNGNIAPCFSPWVWETDTSVKDESLGELWYGEYFDEYRNMMLLRDLPDQCKRCCVWEVWQNRDIREELDKRFESLIRGSASRLKERLR